MPVTRSQKGGRSRYERTDPPPPAQPETAIETAGTGSSATATATEVTATTTTGSTESTATTATTTTGYTTEATSSQQTTVSAEDTAPVREGDETLRPPSQPSYSKQKICNEHEELHLPPPPTIVPEKRYEEMKKENVNLSELASAIALAARSGQPTMQRHFIELPYFNGSHHEWLSFRAAFEDTAQQYSEAENIARLRRSLKGYAKEAVESLLLYNGSTYDIMKQLETRFGRPDAIALGEMDRLRNLPRLTDSPKDICVFSSKVMNIIATLRVLRQQEYLCNPEVSKLIVEKLTPTQRYRWYDFAAEQSTSEPKILKLARFLEREAIRCGPYAPPENIPNSQPQQQHKNNSSVPQHRRNVQKTYTVETSTCAFCEKQGHTNSTCKEFQEADINKRWDLAKSKLLCFRCLKHRTKKHSCPPKKCNIDGCERTHHPLLHFVRKEDSKTEVVASTWSPTDTQVYLKILPVQVAGPYGAINTFALLDDGSTVTLIDSSIAAKIGARGPTDPLRIEAIAHTEVEASKSERVTLTLHTQTASVDIEARTFTSLQLSPQRVNRTDIERYPHLADIADKLCIPNAKPQLLIGQDNWHLLIASEIRKGQQDQPVASLTKLGWVLHGAHTRTLGRQIHYVNHIVSSENRNEDEEMNQQLKQYFALESLAITPKLPTSDPEKRALEILREHTYQREDGHFETSLLWKKENTSMPDNYENAMKRLKTTEKKIDSDPKLKQKYEEQMEALITKGYAELAPPEKDSNRTWYLPHFAVLNPMKPDKVRVVHDAAAKTKGVSLNDCLLIGPDLLQSLPGVLMRLRQHSIAVSADIREMFMQIKIREQDRDALRYLWRGSERENQPIEYRMTSLIFGAACSPSTAIFVKNINAKQHEDKHPEACEAIILNHYVDDYLQSFETIEEAIKIATEVRNIHQLAHFELRQWTSNSKEVLKALDNSSDQSEVALQDTKIERVLGLVWKPNTDELTFNLNLARLPQEALNKKQPTKRETLKIMMSLFDPLGFASPITVRAKQILQEIWRRGTGWDEEIDEDLAKQWTDWIKHLQNLSKISIPRCYSSYSQAKVLQLHIFVDASETAYAATAYWRAETEDGRVHISLVLAKAKVAPLKVTSIPRLELQAAVMGSRIAASIIEEHDRKPDEKIFWTDSRTVLTWVKTGARSYKPYVAHRIAAIEEHSTANEWHWVPTKLNVADDATRNVPENFNIQHRWFTGPEFLQQDPSSWPSNKIEPEKSTGEEKAYFTTTKTDSPNYSEAIPDSTRFSRWERLLRATARVLQFIQLCKNGRQRAHYKRNSKNKEKDPTWGNKRKNSTLQDRTIVPVTTQRRFKPIDAHFIIEAETIVVRATQQVSFKEEIRAINSGGTLHAANRLRNLSTEIVNGIVRLKSRINAASNINENMKSPAVLDGNHHAVKLYIDFVHRKLHHSSVEATINECRQEYWVLRLRPIARMVIHRCLPCRIRKTTPTEPPTGNHPVTRLAHHRRPFSFTGVDYFGPITVTVGRSTQKRYVALFTCLTTRAVHLEIAASLSTDSAIMALRRMIARRGCPTEIWSDNGTNLRGAAKELRQAIDEATQAEAANRKIVWRFIPPAAPFMGGAWERLVRSVKNALTTTLHERSPNEEVLATLLAEAEYTVNSRPLTHVSTDPADPEALTPNHFLLGGAARVPLSGTFDDSDCIGKTHWRASQRLADIFWARWLKEYLPLLQHRREPVGRGEPLKLGDVVLIVDSTLPRNTWPRGIVIAIYPGPDGVVRTADVRTQGGVLRRPTKRLVILPTASTVPSTDGASPC